ncbi:tyrosine-type recombinase/integrase [Enterobacter kobei]|uniref:tyrosine-type recombinase/integrase n=1 Tax=Enterobacter kobei TaxID=208224 RepID=UPI0009941990|nr:site-specific integrase [Enterobacter kobei]OOV69534.1 integrase [Enterobacter kobei]
MKKYSVNSFVFKNGERFCHVVNKFTGEPIYYPNLYLITQVRNQSNSINTMQSIAGGLVLLQNFFSFFSINIEERILKLEFLSFDEITSLLDYMSKSFKKGKVISTYVKGPTKYFRFIVICDYIKWLCNVILSSSNHKNVGAEINSFINNLKNERPSNTDRYQKNISDKTLTQRQIDLIFHILKPGGMENPFSLEVQSRNRLIILLLYSLGLRAGELLNLRISDIDLCHSTIAIRRRADDKSDPRLYQPLVKTCERKLPIGDVLMKEIYKFITGDRNKVRNSKGNDFLFITNKSGKTVGMPLSKSAYHKIIKIISKSHAELNELSGHMLRHTWNYDFSKNIDEMDECFSEEREAKIRSYIMGWCPGSEMAKIYNRRHIEEESYKTSLSFQNKMMEKFINE